MAGGIQPIVVAFPVGASSEQTLTGIEAASQTYKLGAPLVTSSGKIAVGGTNPRNVLGFADVDASGTTDAEAPYHPALLNMMFEGSLDDTLSGSNAPLTHALAQTDVYAVAGLTVDAATGFWYIDASKTTDGTNSAVVVMGLKDPIGAKPGDAPTALNSGGGRVYFMMLSEATAFHRAAS